MLSQIKKIIVSSLEVVHLKLFGHEMSVDMKRFVGHLSWSVLGGVSASVVMMGVNITAGRLMGPDEYGRYNLLLTLASMISIPILFGLDTSSVIAISSSNDSEEKRGNISSAFYFVLSSIMIMTLLFTFSLPYLTIRFALGKTFFLTTFTFAIALSLKIILDAGLRGLHLFKYQYYGRMAEISSILLFFVVLFGIEKKYDYLNYVYALLVGAGILIFFYFIRIRGPFRFFHNLII